MRIAFFTYPAAFQNIGGGEIVLLKMREALLKKGIDVHLLDTWQDRVETYDILHVFGTVKDCLGVMRAAQARGVKIVVTPIIWSDWRRAFFESSSVPERARLCIQHFTKVIFPSFPSERREMMMLADRVLPNAQAELEHISKLFAIPQAKMRVVPNGVDPVFASGDPVLFRQKYGEKKFILSTGRIEPRKNQLNLIRALKGAGHRLVLIGSAVSGYEKYAEECRREGQGSVEFVPGLQHRDPLLSSAYAACEAFVLPGWFETPGLAAMEAAVAGAALAVTQVGSTREYFGKDAQYFDPSSPKDMQQKILTAFSSGRQTALSQKMLQRYTWEHVAAKTIEIYKEIVP